jgi:hypothetical protein
MKGTTTSRLPELALLAPIEDSAMKELSPMELLLRLGGRAAILAGVLGAVVWLTWVMLDVKHMQSGFTLPS